MVRATCRSLARLRYRRPACHRLRGKDRFAPPDPPGISGGNDDSWLLCRRCFPFVRFCFAQHPGGRCSTLSACEWMAAACFPARRSNLPGSSGSDSQGHPAEMLGCGVSGRCAVFSGGRRCSASRVVPAADITRGGANGGPAARYPSRHSHYTHTPTPTHPLPGVPDWLAG